MTTLTRALYTPPLTTHASNGESPLVYALGSKRNRTWRHGMAGRNHTGFRLDRPGGGGASLRAERSACLAMRMLAGGLLGLVLACLAWLGLAWLGSCGHLKHTVGAGNRRHSLCEDIVAGHLLLVMWHGQYVQ